MSTPVTTAYRGGHDGAPGWWFGFEYDQTTVDAIKDEVPSRYRTYDQVNELWWVHVEWIDVVLVILPGLEAYTKQAPLL